MRVAVVGAGGVVGRAAVTALVDFGYDVVGLARSQEAARALHDAGAESAITDLRDIDGLAAMFAGADAVCHFVTHVPAGPVALHLRAWRRHDRLRTEGARCLTVAAREARVRRIVAESSSLLYADQGEVWLSESSPLEITSTTEPLCVAESHVQEFAAPAAGGGRVGVVLRLGSIVGDNEATRARVRAARHGHPVAMGSPDGYSHVIHTDDLGSAVVAALAVPSGVYNVGAEPVRRRELVDAFAVAGGRTSGGFAGSLARRVGGARLEPLSRSLRVSSDTFVTQSGWRPRRARFDVSWVVQGRRPREVAR